MSEASEEQLYRWHPGRPRLGLHASFIKILSPNIRSADLSTTGRTPLAVPTAEIGDSDELDGVASRALFSSVMYRVYGYWDRIVLQYVDDLTDAPLVHELEYQVQEEEDEARSTTKRSSFLSHKNHYGHVWAVNTNVRGGIVSAEPNLSGPAVFSHFKLQPLALYGCGPEIFTALREVLCDLLLGLIRGTSKIPGLDVDFSRLRFVLFRGLGWEDLGLYLSGAQGGELANLALFIRDWPVQTVIHGRTDLGDRFSWFVKQLTPPRGDTAPENIPLFCESTDAFAWPKDGDLADASFIRLIKSRPGRTNQLAMRKAARLVSGTADFAYVLDGPGLRDLRAAEEAGGKQALFTTKTMVLLEQRTAANSKMLPRPSDRVSRLMKLQTPSIDAAIAKQLLPKTVSAGLLSVLNSLNALRDDPPLIDSFYDLLPLWRALEDEMRLKLEAPDFPPSFQERVANFVLVMADAIEQRYQSSGQRFDSLSLHPESRGSVDFFLNSCAGLFNQVVSQLKLQSRFDLHGTACSSLVNDTRTVVWPSPLVRLDAVRLFLPDVALVLHEIGHVVIEDLAFATFRNMAREEARDEIAHELHIARKDYEENVLHEIAADAFAMRLLQLSAKWTVEETLAFYDQWLWTTFQLHQSGASAFWESKTEGCRVLGPMAVRWTTVRAIIDRWDAPEWRERREFLKTIGPASEVPPHGEGEGRAYETERKRVSDQLEVLRRQFFMERQEFRKSLQRLRVNLPPGSAMSDPAGDDDIWGCAGSLLDQQRFSARETGIGILAAYAVMAIEEVLSNVTDGKADATLNGLAKAAAFSQRILESAVWEGGQVPPSRPKPFRLLKSAMVVGTDYKSRNWAFSEALELHELFAEWRLTDIRTTLSFKATAPLG